MKILAPVNSASEARAVVGAGADEVYCGILPAVWQGEYSQVASPSRREWATANLHSYHQLAQIVSIAHDKGVTINLAVNALYTQSQYPLLLKLIEEARRRGVDAFIVADVGLLVRLRKEGLEVKVHVSTGGTAFNAQTVHFYEQLGASRIVLPRQLRVDEIKECIAACPGMEFEVFILNSGCKNIDGFCTFHHGIAETKRGQLWNIPKRYNLDRFLLRIVRRLPGAFVGKIRVPVCGVDSACLIPYHMSLQPDTLAGGGKNGKGFLQHLLPHFSLLSGVDSCGACRLAQLRTAGVHGVKIVGRNYSVSKKVKDVTFIRTVLSRLGNETLSEVEAKAYIKDIFKKTYGISCQDICYYPFEQTEHARKVL